jgi:hypothetical protein
VDYRLAMNLVCFLATQLPLGRPAKLDREYAYTLTRALDLSICGVKVGVLEEGGQKRSTMRRIACLFILVFAVALVPAMADVSVSGLPFGDWAQGGWSDAETSYNTITVEYLGGAGGPLAVPAFTDLSNGWTETVDNGTLAIATGSPTTNENWTFNFPPANPAPLTLEYWASLNGTVVPGDNGLLGYLDPPQGSSNQGGGWWWLPESDPLPSSSVPEPGVVSLLFTMLAGVGGLAGALRKKLS